MERTHFLPIFKKIELEIQGLAWELYFDEIYTDLISSDEGIQDCLHDELNKVCRQSFTKDFIRTQVLSGVPLSLAVFSDSKRVVVFSKSLSKEAFLVSHISPSTLNETQKEAFLKLKAFVEDAQNIDRRDGPTEIELLSGKLGLELPAEENYQKVYDRAGHYLKEMITALNSYKPTFFESLTDFGLKLTADYALVRIHVLKFLALLPSLDYDNEGVEIKRILLETLRRLLVDCKKAKKQRHTGQKAPLPTLYYMGCKVLYSLAASTPAGPLSKIVRKTVKEMAKRFIAGESISSATKCLSDLRKTKRDATIDQLGELVVSVREADHYKDKVLEIIHGLNKHIPRGELNKSNILCAHMSIKVTALCSDFRPEAFDYTYGQIAPRLREILMAGRNERVFINIDAEHYHYRDAVFEIYKKVLLETAELSSYDQTGIVLQTYLRDSYDHFSAILDLAKTRGLRMPIRIVKGAYWDAETVEASAHGFTAPQFLNKPETDIHFRQLVEQILKNSEHLTLCIASHNVSDHCFAKALKEVKYPNAPVIEHQCLHMTYEALSVAMAEQGWPTRNYVPVGSLLVGMAYLVRRIMENSSQVGILNMMRANANLKCLHDPVKELRDGEISNQFDKLNTISQTFENITPVRLYLKEQRDDFFKGLDNFHNCLGHSYSSEGSGDDVQIISPNDGRSVVGNINFFNASEIPAIVDRAHAVFVEGSWAKSSPETRAAFILSASEKMLLRRTQLAALICYEAGKSVGEALADVDEAIDFMNFYAREEVKFHRTGSGAENHWTARGVSAVICPWNFPLAIPTGMTISSLVAGNSVLVKSSEQTPLVAQVMVDILHQSGVPKDVLIHLPGLGEVGAALVNHPLVNTIVFTGSKAVGSWIYENAASRIYRGNDGIELKTKVVTEMGGKNAVIVTANAELDETVSGILYSSFAHAGQKCSACSRIIIDNGIREKFVSRFRDAVLDIKVGQGSDPATYINPLISAGDKKRLTKQAKLAVEEALEFGGRVIVDRTTEEHPGHAIGPCVVELPKERAMRADSFASTELFGPVVHVIGYDSLEDAVEIYNSSEYALTGGIFSQSQDDIDYLMSKMEAGNIYVNRGCTGARVAIEPFGGHKHSGTGPKAGSPQYLEIFHAQGIQAQRNTDQELDKGSEYLFDLKLESTLPLKLRLERIEMAVARTIQRDHQMIACTGVDVRGSLLSFKEWMNGSVEKLLTTTHPNLKIPGQMSFNDYTMTKNSGLLVAYYDIPDLKALLELYVALAVGAGVTVLTRTQKAYLHWSTIVDTLNNCGIPKSQVEVFFPSEERLELALAEKSLDFVIVDGSSNQVEKVSKIALSSILARENMLSVFSSYDGRSYYFSDSYEKLLDKYILVRSMAVNTMRHGAPLDLEF
jgi:RHH-type transcriptional regulator, proline utilization regulon repressor / proline dehydrogenase / delta 1-pyrroline-5-carboxylate dehydrogenase